MPKKADPEAAKPVDASEISALKWATPAVDFDPPMGLDRLLQCLQLLATDAARKEGASWLGGTPASLQAIKSGALSSTKWASGAVATLGGVTGAIATIGGYVKSFGTNAGDAATVALIAGGAGLLGAVAIALAIFVGTDLLARGMATAARHQGRAEVASAFLTATAAMPSSTVTGTTPSSTGSRTVTELELMLALAAFPGKVLITTERHQDKLLKRIAFDSSRGEVFYATGTDEVYIDEIKSFQVKA